MDWHGLPILIGLLAALPFLQFFAGILPYSGQAWVYTTYMLGLLLVMLAGAAWEATSPGEAADGLFVAIGIASIVSVGLQLIQWLGIVLSGDELQIWTGEFSPGRPSANLAQPNQLATLLLWGLLAAAWGVARRKISMPTAVLMAVYVLFGIALTQSRIAIVAMFLIMIAAWVWRRLWKFKVIPWVVSMLFAYLLLCVFSLQYLSNILHLDLKIRPTSLGGASTQLRLKAYKLFLHAIQENPWFGYGEYQVSKAQLTVAQDHPNLTSFFTHSHNLFLDFLLWWGIPVGLLVSICLLVWFVRCWLKVISVEDFILAMFLLVVGLHAMVEFPLHHAYFLLPVGLVVGMLNRRQDNKIYFKVNRWIVMALWVLSSLLLYIISMDYIKIENNFRSYRLEVSPLRQPVTERLPNVFLLNDFYEFLRSVREDVHPNISEEELEQLRAVTYVFPTSANLFNFIKALTFRHKYAEAYVWMKKIQKVLPDGYYEDLGKVWTAQSREQPALTAVTWLPAETEGRK